LSVRLIALIMALLCLLLWLGGCSAASADRERCITCHQGIEHVSRAHPGCVSCHGGNPAAGDKTEAHAGMLAEGNPSATNVWQDGCGRCHRYQLERVKSTIMQTNSGMIRNIQLTWEGEDGRPYSTSGGEQFDGAGRSIKLNPVVELDNLSGELYRKFCSRCHIGISNSDSYAAAHSSGCAACHFPWNDTATYAGGDKTVRGKAGYSASHALEPLPDTQVCARCHNRSGRIALSYQGLNDGNNGLVPTSTGEGGPFLPVAPAI